MRDLDRALADISRIREQLAAGTMFRGFGPMVMAATGALALLTATAQSVWPATFAASAESYLYTWTATAVLACILIGFEMVARSKRHHGGLADQMIFNAVELFLPAGFAGAALTGVVLRFAPEAAWMLPGLWQLLVALGLFAAVRMLPRTIAIAAGWYFVAGIAVLIIASADKALAPWLMGLPFAVGQMLIAVVLHFASGEDNGET
ncbi:MAG: hypothetical protein RLZ98_3363 [Pseudomonadota bacterium]|jgi:hypothetical protein